MKQYTMEEAMPLGVLTFYRLFFESPDFEIEYHNKCGHQDVQVGPWTNAPGGRKQRVVRFKTAGTTNTLIRKLAGENTHVKEIQLHHFANDGSFVLTSTIFFEKSSLGESLTNKVEWRVEATTEGCMCSIRARNEYKGRLFKESIEAFVKENTMASLQKWMEVAREKLARYRVDPLRGSLPGLASSSSSIDMISSPRQQQRPSSTTTRRGGGNGYRKQQLATSTSSAPSSPLSTSIPSSPRLPPFSPTATRYDKGKRERGSDSQTEYWGSGAGGVVSEADDEESEEGYAATNNNNEEEEEEEEDHFFDSIDDIGQMTEGAGVNEQVEMLQYGARALQGEIKHLEAVLARLHARLMYVEEETGLSFTGNIREGDDSGSSSSPRGLHQRMADLRKGLEEVEQRMDDMDGYVHGLADNLRHGLSRLEEALSEQQQQLLLFQQQQQEKRMSIGRRPSTLGRQGRGWASTLTRYTAGGAFLFFVMVWPLVAHRVVAWVARRWPGATSFLPLGFISAAGWFRQGIYFPFAASPSSALPSLPSSSASSSSSTTSPSK